MKHFSGRTAFITGGASGIGLGMAQCFMNEGMNVVIADFNPQHLAAARGLLGERAAHFIQVDVSDRKAVRAAADEAITRFGKIHVLCNNAGVGGGGSTADDEFDEWDRAIGITLGGVVNCTKIIAPHIIAHGEGGHIVNTSSMAGIVPAPDLGAYSTAKYAVRGFSESLRMTMAPHGIGVSCLFPGATRTALVDIPETDDGLPDDERGDYLRKLFAAMRVAVDPIEIGRQVLQAIRENRLYILTHAEFLPELKRRHQAIENAFPTDTNIPSARREFEELRGSMVDALFSMPARD